VTVHSDFCRSFDVLRMPCRTVFGNGKMVGKKNRCTKKRVKETPQSRHMRVEVTSIKVLHGCE